MSIERKLVIGIITSTELLRKLRGDIQAELFTSTSAQYIVQWCLEYFDEYGKAPEGDLESLYFQKLHSGVIPKDIAEEFESELLPELSEEFEEDGVNVEYLLQMGHEYLKEQSMRVLIKKAEMLLDKGEMQDAEHLLKEFKTTVTPEDEVELTSVDVGECIREAIEATYTPVIEFGGALGKIWNGEMVKGGFVAFLAPEKRGKSIMLMELAKRAKQQGRRVAFIQAGDMTRNQMIRRMAINISGKVLSENKAGVQYMPLKDCVMNQLNLCSKSVRECSFGVFEDSGWDEKSLRNEVTFMDIQESLKNDPDYKTCHNCKEFQHRHWGAVYMKQHKVNLLTTEGAIKEWRKFMGKNDKNFRLATYANGALTVEKLERLLDTWQMEGFVPEVILLDYADLVELEKYREERHKQNQVWKKLRGISQLLDCLLITVTQSDAASYEQDTLKLKNFSEDKRKYAHVTAMFGLNWDKHGREKKLKLMRINQLVLREDEFESTESVYILQQLNLYRGICDSFI